MGQILMTKNQYAPIKQFDILQDVFSSGPISGLASPVAGSQPCALALVAGTKVVAVATATAFSPVALKRNMRLGWCGFEIGGLSQAVATGHDVELRCHATGQVQVRWDGAILALRLTQQHRKHLTVQDMLRKLSSNITIADVEQVLPFAMDLARRQGSRPFVKASYRYFLGRLPEPEAETRFAGDYTTHEPIREFWNVLINSPEAGAIRQSFLPGPFDPSFPFPLNILDRQQVDPL